MMGRRIIPARAGFTLASTRPGQPAPDHPRSRGVYSPWLRQFRPEEGSSPLARGLPHDGALAGGGGRIIPARAGFTPPGQPWPPAPPDHPRSRGVYPGRPRAEDAVRGSSPLARGLRRPPVQRAQAVRIIPARAGFTPRERPGTVRSADHPRSRGVYPAGTRKHDRIEGSSPLARGLQPGPGTRRNLQGIIPARAGFTFRDFRPLIPPSGSSPLARGLPLDAAADAAALRIIPARAGFTLDPTIILCIPADHPRSRGVYASFTRTTTRLSGSSPLARGLPKTMGAHVPLGRIIPARAGFTLADPWNPNEPVLYQTPAAFTADPGPAPPSCGSAVVVPRWTTTPSGA